MSGKAITLVCVRHGQADHNVEGNEKLFKYTQDDSPVLDTHLTELGRKEVVLVGKRLAAEAFDLSISSDLERARDTAQAIATQNESIDTVEEWKIVRERFLGIFEGKIPDLCRAQIIVEDAIEDRDLLTWRIPNGESVVDLKHRIEDFLSHLIKEARRITSPDPRILVVSHGLFLKELHHVLSSYGTAGPMFGKGNIFHANTAVSEYRISYDEEKDDIEHVDCLVYASGEHLAGLQRKENRKASFLLYNHCNLEEKEAKMKRKITCPF